MFSFVRNLDDLSLHLEIPVLELFRMVKTPEAYYKIFRLQKKSGGYRKISAPSAALKSAQKWIATRLLPPELVHEAATGYRVGQSIVDNARRHTSKDWVYNVNLEQFFPSVRADRIDSLFRELGFNNRFAAELTRLCTLHHELPQGAPSSPMLANLICRRLDERLSKLAATRGWSYTRYCDDITMSGNGRIEHRDERLVRRVINEEGFAVNAAKVRVNRKNSRQTVTGLVVNRFPNIDRQSRHRVRAMLHHYKRARIMDPGGEGITNQYKVDAGRLQGYIAFMRMVRSDDKSLSLR